MCSDLLCLCIRLYIRRYLQLVVVHVGIACLCMYSWSIMLSSNPTSYMHGTPCNHSPTCSQSIVFGYRATGVSGDRECRKSPPHNNTTITSTHQHTITYKQLHKMTSWNKQGWANENIIVHQTAHSFRVCGQLYPWEKTSHT